MVAAGWNAAWPDALLELVLTPEAIELLDVVDTGCTGAIAAVFGGMEWEELVATNPEDVEPWASLLIENDPGFVVGASPVLIIHGGNDEQIPVLSSLLLRQRMCGIGQVVHRRVYPGASHAGVIGVSFGDMLHWIDARLAGQPAPNDCT
jgi:hypothetical protein